jgi:hypothetical protein
MEELAQCKRAVEERTRTSVTALAYPVGNPLAFNADTKAAAEACGYRLAFSYYGGVNRVGSIDRWNVRRMPVEAGMSVARIRFELAVQRLSHNGED